MEKLSKIWIWHWHRKDDSNRAPRFMIWHWVSTWVCFVITTAFRQNVEEWGGQSLCAHKTINEKKHVQIHVSWRKGFGSFSLWLALDVLHLQRCEMSTVNRGERGKLESDLSILARERKFGVWVQVHMFRKCQRKISRMKDYKSFG